MAPALFFHHLYLLAVLIDVAIVTPVAGAALTSAR